MPAAPDMDRAFADRGELVDYLRREFPAAASGDGNVSPTVGGRSRAEAVLRAIHPDRYAQTRNFLNGDVTRLSAYIRHGVLTLAEVRDAALTRVDHPSHAAKLINELGWRDYWRRVLATVGDSVWRDLEPPRTNHPAGSYAVELPDDLATGRTGLACIDGFVRELRETGYLHNHARLWLAAYTVHWRRVRWQAGARWFLANLLDGDPASNNLSWQWVTGTFSNKPYFFNRENLEHFTEGIYCRSCPHQTDCPLQGSYEEIGARLFPGGIRPGPSRLHLSSSNPPDVRPPREERRVVWVHDDDLNPFGPALRAGAGSPAVYVWDDARLERDRVTLKRIAFVYECLLEMPVVIRRGDPAAEVLRFAEEHGAREVVTTASTDPDVLAVRRNIESHLPVAWVPVPPFLSQELAFDLTRFSRYWKDAEPFALAPTGQGVRP